MQAPIAHSFLMVFIFFSGLGLTIKPDDGKIHLVSILPSILVLVFVGMAIGKALENSRQTYLWSTNLVYQQLNKTILIFLPLAISGILMLFVLLSGSGNEIFVLLGLMFLYTMILSFDLKKSSKMILMYLPVLLVIQIKGKADLPLVENYGLLIVFGYYGVILFDSIVKYWKNKGYIKETFNSKAEGKLLIHRFQMLAPNYSNGNVGLSLSENGLEFPLFGVMLGIVVVGYTAVMNVFIVNEMKTGLILTLMFMLNFLMGFSLKFNMRQVKNFAHVFKGQNHAGIKRQLIIAMDKKLLLNNLSFIGIILSAMLLLDLPFNKLELIITMFISLIFIINTYLFVMSLNAKMKIEVGFVLLITYAILSAMVFTLTVSYKESFYNWSFDLGILICAMVVRFIAERQFYKTKFENLIT